MDPVLFALIFGVGFAVAMGAIAFESKALAREVDREVAATGGSPVQAVSTMQPVEPAAPVMASQEPSPGELLFWQSIKDSQDVSEFSAYLAQFPQGFFRDLARNRLASLGVEVSPIASPSLPASTVAPTQAPAASVAAATTSPPPAQTGAPSTRAPGSGNALIWAALVIGVSIFGAVWLWISVASYADCVNLVMVQKDIPRSWAEKSCQPSSS